MGEMHLGKYYSRQHDRLFRLLVGLVTIDFSRRHLIVAGEPRSRVPYYRFRKIPEAAAYTPHMAPLSAWWLG